ncbi:MAG TPA: ribonuclease III [Bacteroidetes bacterium]|nr:ribonuclease III [Bacteroidota bacterium]
MRTLARQIIAGLFSLNRSFSSKVFHLTGYYPMNAQLYHLAFLHSSISSETNLSNERLEFLGDAVLSLVVADYLFQKFPFRNEGYLTDLRSKMVSRNNLNNIAHRMGIEEMLQYNKQDTFLNKKSISGNALEALIGAVYLDHGYAGAQKFIMNKIIAQHIDIEDLEASEFNYKSKILEWAQKNEVKIEFTVLEETRDKRHSFFKVALMVNGNETGIGEDNSKKIAEKKAAKEGFAKLGILEK